MKKIRSLLSVGVLSCLLSPLAAYSQAADEVKPDQTFSNTQSIETFINEMVSEHEFKQEELTALFKNAKRIARILEVMEKPAEKKPWHEYRPIFLSEGRIKGGLEFWKSNADSLERAHTEYGVPPQIIVAIIGVETRYGRHKGSYAVLDSLSTLAFEYPPRSAFFRKELKQYLLMSREEKVDPLVLTGSYAGAMGLPQFIPSSFRHYAIDFDADGKRDLWENNTDAIGSVANYFKRHGWQAGEPIATRVSVDGEKYKALVSKSIKPAYTAKELMAAGVSFPGKVKDDMQGALLEFETADGHEYWVGWHNFYVISRYNHSKLYSLAVFQLSNEILTTH